MRNTIILGALAASIQTVSAAQAYVKNYCNFDVSLWPVDQDRRTPSPVTLKAGGGDYSEQYHTPLAGGVSLKLAPGSSNAVPITQFEYTLIGGFIWYDGSNVDCTVTNCPFYEYGIYMDTSDPSCPTRTCLPNQRCDGFYNLYNDDINSLACQPGADIHMYLCATSPNGPSGAAPVSSAPAAISSAAAPSSTPTSAAPLDKPSASESAVPDASSTPVYRMEALHVATTIPTTLKKKLIPRETPLVERHAHMRRHFHQRKH